MTDRKEVIKTSIQKVEKWVEDHNYKGYEPFDGLSSIFRPLTFGNLLLNRLLLQLKNPISSSEVIRGHSRQREISEKINGWSSFIENFRKQMALLSQHIFWIKGQKEM